MITATPDLRLPSQPQSTTARWRYLLLYCFVAEAHVCEQLAQGCYPKAERPELEPATLWVASPTLWPLRYQATSHRLIQPAMLRASLYFKSRARPEGPRAAVGFLGGSSQPPLQQLRDLGEPCKFPSGVLGRTSAAKRFSCIFEAPDGISWILIWYFGAKLGWGHGPLVPR